MSLAVMVRDIFMSMPIDRLGTDLEFMISQQRFQLLKFTFCDN